LFNFPKKFFGILELRHGTDHTQATGGLINTR